MVVLNAKKDNRFKFNKRRSATKVPMRLDITTMNALIGFAFKKSAQINRKSLTNLKKLMDIIDDSLYKSREDLSDRFDLINTLLDARINHSLENDGLLTEFCLANGAPESLVKEIPIYARLSYSDIIGMNKAVAERLNFAYMYAYKEDFEDILIRLESNDYKSMTALNKEWGDLCKDYINETRKVSLIDSSNTFSISDESMDEKFKEIVQAAKNPSKTLTTGIRALNSMLGDGYESGRLYMYVGLPRTTGAYVSDCVS